MGDINIELSSDVDHFEKYKNTLETLDFVSYINQIIRPISKTYLDHIDVKKLNYDYNSIKSFVFDYGITDHLYIALIIQFKEAYEIKNENRHKKFINYPKLREQIRNKNWRNIYKTRVQ